ncbi:hypothetical protein [Primorskyibacter sp. S87]|uniref:hypothetical protein n=1 Tax=Primorskyibacter sp. S87 TaxID=3415126 RepID=UPI003C7A1CAE
MFEIFFAVIAATLQSVGQIDADQDEMKSLAVDSTQPQEMIAAITPEVLDNADVSDPPPAFLSPEQETVAAPPVFLSPQGATEAPPAFLSPDAEVGVATPAFLSPELTPEPQVPSGSFTTATEVKPILEATRGNWVAVREFNGQDLVYVTHLWSWRCGLAEMRLGINGNPPQPWPLPPCHLEQPAPNAILEGDGLPYRPFTLGSVSVIDVELVYDDLSTDQARFNRDGVRIP